MLRTADAAYIRSGIANGHRSHRAPQPAPGAAPGALAERLREFERFLVREDRSPSTVSTYRWGLSGLLAYLGSRGLHELVELDQPGGRAMLEAWVDTTMLGLAPRSRWLATTAARAFLRWAADREYVESRVERWVPRIKVRPLRPKPLDPTTLAALRAFYQHRPQESYQRRHPIAALRDRALFFYLLATGARISEALQVPREGFQRYQVIQKGGTEKLLVIPSSMVTIVEQYLHERRDSAPLLFVSHPTKSTAGPLTAQQVRAIWQRITRRLGLAPFTTHALRHTFATELLDRGVDSIVVAELLGHKGMGTIRNYGQLRPAARQHALDVIDGVISGPRQAPHAS